MRIAMAFWPDQVLIIVRTVAIFSTLVFGVAEVKGKRKYVAGMIISAVLALTAQLAEWGVNVYRSRASHQVYTELLRARYHFDKFQTTTVMMELPTTNPVAAKLKKRWDDYITDFQRHPKPWQIFIQHPKGPAWSDRKAKTYISGGPNQQVISLAFNRDSELLEIKGHWQDPLGRTIEGNVAERTLNPHFLLGFTRDVAKATIAPIADTWARSPPPCDLSVDICGGLSTPQYDVTYFPQKSVIQIIATDSSWTVLANTGSITSFVDFPGCDLVLATEFEDVNLMGLFLSSETLPGFGKNLEIKGEDCRKLKVGTETVFIYRIKQADLGILSAVGDQSR